MQSTDLEEIKAAIFEQAYHPCTRVKWGVAQVMAIRRSKGQLQVQLRGRARWYPVEAVTIERPRLCPTGACDIEGIGVRDALPQLVLFLPDDWAEALKRGSILTSFEDRIEISLLHKRSRKMTTQPKAVQPIPEGYHSVTPWIISRETAKLLDFLRKAFGAEELGRVYNEDGAIDHAEVKLGDSVVMAFDAREEWPATPCFLRLYVPDGDAVYQQALAAGATAVTEMTSLAFGDRVGRIRDPFGNLWWIQTRLENLAPKEMAKRAAEPQYHDAMRLFQESLEREMKPRSAAESRTETSR